MAEDVRKVPLETEQPRARLVIYVVAGWFVFAVVAIVFFQVLMNSLGPLPRPPGDRFYPQPQLVTQPETELAPYLAAQKKQLSGSGWIDKAQGIAHIPIDQAMADIARRPDPYAPLTPIRQETSP